MADTPRLPQPGGDNGDWGGILNEFLLVSHNEDGTLNAGGNPIANVGEPSDDQDVATKAYVDANSGNLPPQWSVNAGKGEVTTGNPDNGNANYNVLTFQQPNQYNHWTALEVLDINDNILASMDGDGIGFISSDDARSIGVSSTNGLQAFDTDFGAMLLGASGIVHRDAHMNTLFETDLTGATLIHTVSDAVVLDVWPSADQTQNIQQWRGTDGTPVAWITADGTPGGTLASTGSSIPEWFFFMSGFPVTGEHMAYVGADDQTAIAVMSTVPGQTEDPSGGVVTVATFSGEVIQGQVQLDSFPDGSMDELGQPRVANLQILRNDNTYPAPAILVGDSTDDIYDFVVFSGGATIITPSYPGTWSDAGLTVDLQVDIPGVAIMAAPGQTANLQEWSNLSGRPQSWIDADGKPGGLLAQLGTGIADAVLMAGPDDGDEMQDVNTDTNLFKNSIYSHNLAVDGGGTSVTVQTPGNYLIEWTAVFKPNDEAVDIYIEIDGGYVATNGKPLNPSINTTITVSTVIYLGPGQVITFRTGSNVGTMGTPQYDSATTVLIARREQATTLFLDGGGYFAASPTGALQSVSDGSGGGLPAGWTTDGSQLITSNPSDPDAMYNVITFEKPEHANSWTAFQAVDNNNAYLGGFNSLGFSASGPSKGTALLSADGITLSDANDFIIFRAIPGSGTYMETPAGVTLTLHATQGQTDNLQEWWTAGLNGNSLAAWIAPDGTPGGTLASGGTATAAAASIVGEIDLQPLASDIANYILESSFPYDATGQTYGGYSDNWTSRPVGFQAGTIATILPFIVNHIDTSSHAYDLNVIISFISTSFTDKLILTGGTSTGNQADDSCTIGPSDYATGGSGSDLSYNSSTGAVTSAGGNTYYIQVQVHSFWDGSVGAGN